jgi:hypothetical protein
LIPYTSSLVPSSLVFTLVFSLPEFVAAIFSPIVVFAITLLTIAVLIIALFIIIATIVTLVVVTLVIATITTAAAAAAAIPPIPPTVAAPVPTPVIPPATVVVTLSVKHVFRLLAPVLGEDDGKLAPAQITPVHVTLCILCIALIPELNEPKAPGLLGVVVLGKVNVAHSAIAPELLFQIFD